MARSAISAERRAELAAKKKDLALARRRRQEKERRDALLHEVSRDTQVQRDTRPPPLAHGHA